jgi:hypothetical protein
MQSLATYSIAACALFYWARWLFDVENVLFRGVFFNYDNMLAPCAASGEEFAQ